MPVAQTVMKTVLCCIDGLDNNQTDLDLRACCGSSWAFHSLTPALTSEQCVHTIILITHLLTHRSS